MSNKWEEQTNVMEESSAKLQRPRRFLVIMLNDDFTPMDFVTAILVDLFDKSELEARCIMMDIHKKGRGIVGIYPKSIAEMKIIEVHEHAKENGFPLTCRMEPEEGNGED